MSRVPTVSNRNSTAMPRTHHATERTAKNYIRGTRQSSSDISAYSRKPSLFHDLARAAIIARVSIARVDLGLALVAVEAGGAGARVLLLAVRGAGCTVRARVGVADVTLGEDLSAHGTWGEGMRSNGREKRQTR